MFAAALLAFCSGFLSLSIEILWIRLFAFTNHSMPQAFAFVLAMFLIGIACGAYIGKWFCKKKSYDLWLISGLVLIVSSVCDLVGPWIYADWALSQHQLLIGGSVIILTALLKAIVFPIAHHLGTPSHTATVGKHISHVYAANILGATIGPLITGIFLLAFFTTQQSFIICAMATFFLAMFCLRPTFKPIAWSACMVVMSCQFVFIFMMNHHELMLRVASPLYGKIIKMVENQYGIIAIYAGKNGDIVAGGNAYDGHTNLNPVLNSNRINRVIIMSALVDSPSRVLMIGLSIGSWLKLVTSFPGVEHIDVVEINPGYLELIRGYPAQESGILDPRVHIHIDDARRWLKAHADNRYDMIIMNTTYHWRAYVTNLLSQEFLKLLKHHMSQNAVLEYNTTGSPDVLKTAHSVFKHAYLYENFVVAADFDWREKLHTDDAIKKITQLTLDGQSLYPVGSEALIAHYLQLPITPLEKIEPIYNGLGRTLEIITDDNLITEYKYGKTLVSPS